jgi:uncharacterized membrane protein YdjX (TVP38/TMEM64 family)
MRTILAFVALFLAVSVAVMVPFVLWGETMEAWANGLLARTDNPVLFAGATILLLASDLLLPLPSSLIALGAGAKLGLGAGAVAVFSGLMLGNTAGYVLGRRYGQGFAAKMAGRTAEMPDHVGGAIVCLTRTVPVFSEAITVVAGAGNLPLRVFLVSAGLGNLGYALTYAWIGYTASLQNSFALIVLAAVTLPVIGYAAYVAWLRSGRARARRA